MLSARLRKRGRYELQTLIDVSSIHLAPDRRRYGKGGEKKRKVSHGRRKREREKGCFVARATTSTLRLTLMLVDIDVRHPPCFKSAYPRPRRARCVTFNLPPLPRDAALAYCKSQTEIPVDCTRNKLRDRQLQGTSVFYRRYIFWL